MLAGLTVVLIGAVSVYLLIAACAKLGFCSTRCEDGFSL